MKARALHDAVEGLSRKLSDAYSGTKRRLASAQQQLLTAEAELLDAYRQFSGIQLGEAAAVSLPEIRKVLIERDRALAEAMKKLPMIEAGIARETKELHDLQERIELAEAQVAHEAATDLAVVSAALGQRDAAAEEALLRTNLIEIDGEVEDKRPGYEDSVFQYLKARRYGTADYSGKGLARHLDGWLARRSHFAENVANLQILEDMRDIAADRCEAAQHELGEAQQSVDHAMATLEQEAGLPVLRSAWEQHNSKVSALKGEARELKTLIAQHAEGEDPGWQRAHGLFAEMLSDKTLVDLDRLAAQTANDEDDALVRRIENLRADVADCNDQVRDLKEVAESAEKAYRKAKKLENDFDREGYGRSGYRYDRLDVDGLLTGYMLGRSSTSDVLSTMRSSRSEEESWSSRSSSSSSSSFGSSSFSSSDSFGGGSFSTTDSF